MVIIFQGKKKMSSKMTILSVGRRSKLLYSNDYPLGKRKQKAIVTTYVTSYIA